MKAAWMLYITEIYADVFVSGEENRPHRRKRKKTKKNHEQVQTFGMQILAKLVETRCVINNSIFIESANMRNFS
jgi:Na+-transporting NADH:ubiquinone oxidoreductase subunit NqrA